jgi:hypothetical protein
MENFISLETVRSRGKRGNLDAFNPSQQSPIIDIKPVLCQFCICLGKMGNPLKKSTITELANDLIVETEYQKKLKTTRSFISCKKWESYRMHGTVDILIDFLIN